MLELLLTHPDSPARDFLVSLTYSGPSRTAGHLDHQRDDLLEDWMQHLALKSRANVTY